jgi:hypothetical protein
MRKRIITVYINVLILNVSLTFGQKHIELIPNFPFVNSNVKKFAKIPRDTNGIPMLEYENKKFYYPIQYTQIALHYYSKYLETKEKKDKEEFLKQANFIKDEVVDYAGFSVWECNEEITGYNLTTPWSSAMSQGFGIGVMLQAFKITNDKSYLEVAKRAIEAYKFDLLDNGINNKWNGYAFYEEYADKESHILNGYIFSLSGLYYFYKITGDIEAKRLFDIGIRTLKAKINEYDADFTSYYGKLHNGGYQYASAINNDPDHYHELVIYQLLTLYQWTQEVIFYEYAHKFLKYDTGKVSGYSNIDKYKSIDASYTIDSINYGVDKLNDELWSWGKYWSTNKFPTELTIEFIKEENDISEIVFYSISELTLPENFEIYIFNDNEWIKIINSSEVNYSYIRKYKTGNYETYIKGYPIEKTNKGTKLKIKFLGNSKNLVTLREINVHYDRTEELDQILKLVSREKM